MGVKHKTKRGLQILFNEGILSLISSLTSELEAFIYQTDVSYRYILVPFVLILNQIHLLMSETALAYPTENGDWQILKLYPISRGRRLPTIAASSGYRHASVTHTKMLQQIYTYEGFLEIEDGDVVVDVGAYVGGFSMLAARKADHVLAIEPTASISNVLSYNMRHLSNVTVIPKAAWKFATSIEINQSTHPNENSVLEVDNFGTGTSFIVDADTVPNLVRQEDFESIDFLKIEAEGAEPEILQGALSDGMSIKKIVVDASPERDQVDTVEDVSRVLKQNNYRVRVKRKEKWWGEYIVFGKKVD